MESKLNFSSNNRYRRSVEINKTESIQYEKRGKTSKYRGVTCDKHGMIYAQIRTYLGGRKYLGSFKTEEEAAKAYDTAAKEIYGDKAVLNFK